MAKLKSRYGAELNTPDYHLGDERPYALRLAHQFAYIHQRVKQETRTGEPPGDVQEENSPDQPASAP